MALSVQSSSSDPAGLPDGSIRVVSGSGFRYVTPFPWRLHEMLEESSESSSEDSQIVSWLPDGKSFKVHDPQGFSKKIIPSWFKHKCYKSFQRQLHLYGFRRIQEGPHKGKKFNLVIFLRVVCCCCCCGCGCGCGCAYELLDFATSGKKMGSIRCCVICLFYSCLCCLPVCVHPPPVVLGQLVDAKHSCVLLAHVSDMYSRFPLKSISRPYHMFNGVSIYMVSACCCFSDSAADTTIVLYFLLVFVPYLQEPTFTSILNVRTAR
jgi:hypothetical protein